MNYTHCNWSTSSLSASHSLNSHKPIFVPILQIRKLRPKERSGFQGHTDRKWGSQSFTSSQPAAKLHKPRLRQSARHGARLPLHSLFSLLIPNRLGHEGEGGVVSTGFQISHALSIRPGRLAEVSRNIFTKVQRVRRRQYPNVTVFLVSTIRVYL